MVPVSPLSELQGLTVLQAPFSWAAQGDISKVPVAASRAPRGLAVMPKPRHPSSALSPQQSHTAHGAGDEELAFRSKDPGSIWAVGKTLGHHPGTLSQNGKFTRTPFFSS